MLGRTGSYFVELFWIARGRSESCGESNDASGRKRSKRRIAVLDLLVPVKHNQIIYRIVSDQTCCDASGPIGTVLCQQEMVAQTFGTADTVHSLEKTELGAVVSCRAWK